MAFSYIDYIVVGCYGVILFLLAQWVSWDSSGKKAKSTRDYFLAGNSLPWWAIGASLIAANISAEQIIGMSGSAYTMGLAIASYEWLAAIALLVTAKYLLPVFIQKNILTMPQFLEQRYDRRLRILMASFWLGVYVFINLTSILWLGSLAIETVTGISTYYGMIFLGVFAVAYSLYGGLKSVAMTDLLQVILLVLGGLLLIGILLDTVSNGAGVLAGIVLVLEHAPERFDMILDKAHPHYKDLPGISVLLGGLWVMHFSYWGFNQYIIQRALAAKNLAEAQKGIVFAAFLKIFMPLIVVLPGIIIYILSPNLEQADTAYPQAMLLLPVGIKGLVFAALIAAILSSLASMSNSIATIFTIDIYENIIRRQHQNDRSDHSVTIGRIAVVTAMAIAMITAKPLLNNFDQAFQYIQEFTGFFTPGIVVLFTLGIFWPRTTANGALSAAIASALLSLGIRLLWPALPFIDRVGLVFVLCMLIAIVISLFETRDSAQDKSSKVKGAIRLNDINFKTSRSFNINAAIIFAILSVFYIIWW